jgi:uncharacterized protein YyaL (SSP411 family)
MEHESFESETVAAVMNEYFVNIKVDREERPDVDRVYMTFVQATPGTAAGRCRFFSRPTSSRFMAAPTFRRMIVMAAPVS